MSIEAAVGTVLSITYKMYRIEKKNLRKRSAITNLTLKKYKKCHLIKSGITDVQVVLLNGRGEQEVVSYNINTCLWLA